MQYLNVQFLYIQISMNVFHPLVSTTARVQIQLDPIPVLVWRDFLENTVKTVRVCHYKQHKYKNTLKFIWRVVTPLYTIFVMVETFYFFSTSELSSCSSITCYNGGTCQENAGLDTCVCLPGWTGNQCQFGNDVIIFEEKHYTSFKIYSNKFLSNW